MSGGSRANRRPTHFAESASAPNCGIIVLPLWQNTPLFPGMCIFNNHRARNPDAGYQTMVFNTTDRFYDHFVVIIFLIAKPVLHAIPPASAATPAVMIINTNGEPNPIIVVIR